jgi:protein-S-isoprenylcysteine O-methyltransferase Ste14
MLKVNFEQAVYGWRVKAGFISIVAAVILANPHLSSLLAGLGICLIGLIIRVWASGHLSKEKELAVSGPYRFTRNPLYLANLVIGMSVVVASYSWWVMAIFGAYFLLFYPIAIKKEKKKMKDLFPAEYDEYRKKAPLFFPSLRPLPSLKKNKFSWKLFRKNKEWRALSGAALFWLALTLKMLLL